MTKIDVQIHENVIDIYSKIKNLDDTGIELVISEGSILFDNSINIKLLKKLAQKDGKVLSFTTLDKHGSNIINIADENFSFDTTPYIKYEPKKSLINKITDFGINIQTPKFKFKSIKNLKLGFFIIVILIISIPILGYYTLNKFHKADIKIFIQSQVLSRSITVKVIKDEPNNFDKNVLKAVEVQKSLSNGLSIDVTGKLIEGKKAKGKLIIYNKTIEEKSFKQGETLIYEKNDKKYKFKLLDNNVVPSRIESDIDPSEPIIPGEKEVEIEALEIGEEYNILDNEILEFDDYKSSDFMAKTSTKIEGGLTEIKSVVSQEDLDNLLLEVTKINNNKILSELENSSTNETKYIKGSHIIKVLENKFSHKLNEETNELKLDQSVTATGIAYNQTDLENLITNNIKSLVPNDFEISDQDKELNVEVLGNSISDNLLSVQSDVQVTVRLFIIPKIDTEKLKQDIKGLNLQDGEKIINDINNIKTYQIVTFPNMNLFKKFPKNLSKINVQIERE